MWERNFKVPSDRRLKENVVDPPPRGKFQESSTTEPEGGKWHLFATLNNKIQTALCLNKCLREKSLAFSREQGTLFAGGRAGWAWTRGAPTRLPCRRLEPRGRRLGRPQTPDTGQRPGVDGAAWGRGGLSRGFESNNRQEHIFREHKIRIDLKRKNMRDFLWFGTFFWQYFWILLNPAISFGFRIKSSKNRKHSSRMWLELNNEEVKMGC